MRTALFKPFDLFILLLCFFLIGACSERKIPPKAVKGVLDLRDWDFDPSTGSGTDGVINLDGEWEFYWKEFPIVGAGGELILPEDKKDFINVPSSWNGHVVRRTTESGDILEEKLGGEGYASYKLKVLLPEVIPLSIRVNYQPSAYLLYLNDTLYPEMGLVAKAQESYLPDRKVQYISFQPTSKEVHFTLLLSNFQYFEGGFNHSIFVGSPESISELRINRVALDLFVAGILLIMGVYHLSLFFLRKDDESPLYFGVYCVLVSFRTLIMGEIYLKTMIPNLTYSQNVKTEFFTIYLALPIFNEFISTLYPKEILPPLRKLITWSGYSMSIIVVISSVNLFTSLLLTYQISVLFFIIYAIFIFVTAFLKKRDGAKTIFLGFLFFGVAIINDILYANNIINTGDVGPYGLVIFIFSQSFLLTSRFANAFHQVKDLSLNLEKKVEDRTRDLEDANQRILDSYTELQKTKNEMENQKSQMERIQAMSVEIQKKTDIRDMLQILEWILWEAYRISDFLLVIQNSQRTELTAFYISQNWMRFSLDKSIKNIPLSEEVSIHKLVFEKKRSLFLSKFKNISNGEAEDYNREILGMESVFAIPCIVNNQAFAILSLADIRPEFSRDPNIRGVKCLTPKQREQIEQLVALIANPLYQSLQKQKIEAAYKELQETQSQLIEAERMASLGQLVGGIAHEINNPIAVIRAHAELLGINNQSTLQEVPQFLDSLSTTEKSIFYEIVDKSIKNREFLNTKEERKRKKEIQKEISEYIEDEDLCSTISEQMVTLRFPHPYKEYVDILGGERFSNFLSMARVFKNQSNSLSSIEIAVEKASRVVFALRSYLNTQLFSEKKEVNLPDELEKALRVYDNYVVGKINSRKEYPHELKYFCTSENLLQVWKNLLFNSIQAMYDTDKKLEIRIEKVKNIPEVLKSYKTSSIVEESIFQRKESNDWIIVSITDSGVGIPIELQEKVFTPFFTTKSLGEGIGLGLYTCKKIVHEHGGALFFRSGGGSTEFVVVLPS